MMGRQLNLHNVFSGQESRHRDVNSSQPRIILSNRVTHVLKLVRQRLEVEDKMNGSQLSILAQKHLGSQHLIEI